METIKTPEKNSIAFINDKSPIFELNSNKLVDTGIEVLFRSESIDDGLSQLSVLKKLPQVCIIDLNFYSLEILKQLQALRSKYPNIKLIAHSDIDDEKVVKAILDIGFSSYLLIGSDKDDFKKAINKAVNN